MRPNRGTYRVVPPLCPLVMPWCMQGRGADLVLRPQVET